MTLVEPQRARSEQSEGYYLAVDAYTSFERCGDCPMSMLYELRRISEAERSTLLADPSEIAFFLYGEPPYEPPRGLFARLFRKKTPAPSNTRDWQEPDPDSLLSLEKNWHVLHFIFSRDPWAGSLPAGTLLVGGTEVGNVDVGYGPARVWTQGEVAAFGDYLDTLTQAGYASDVTAELLTANEIYGAGQTWTNEDSAAIWEWVETLRAFLRTARDRDDCMVVYLY